MFLYTFYVAERVIDCRGPSIASSPIQTQPVELARKNGAIWHDLALTQFAGCEMMANVRRLLISPVLMCTNFTG